MSSTKDIYGGQSLLIGPIRRSLTVTPDDATDLAEAPRAIYLSGTGDVAMTLLDEADGTVKTYPNLAGGQLQQFRPKRIWETNTDATITIIACY